MRCFTSESHKPRDFKSFCPLLTFELMLGCTHSQKTGEGRSVVLGDDACLTAACCTGRRAEDTCMHAHLSPRISLHSAHLSNHDGAGWKAGRLPQDSCRSEQFFLPCVECADTECARPREAGAPHRSQIFRPTVS